MSKKIDKLAATPGASGVDYFGVRVDIFVLRVVAISVIGLVFAIASCKISQNRIIVLHRLDLFFAAGTFSFSMFYILNRVNLRKTFGF